MQAGMMALILTTTAYAPLALLQGWLQDIARVNPVTQVVEAARQGFVGGVTWAETWPGLLALAGLLAVLGALALREMRRTALVRWTAQADSRDRRGRAGAAAELAAGASATGPRYAYTAAEPGPLSVAVVLGLLLRGDRLAALRSGAGAGRAGEPARRAAPRRLRRPHDLLATSRSRCSASPSTTSPRAAPCRPRRSSRRCSPGPGGSPSATRPRSRGSAPRWTGSPPTATSRATACSGSCSPTSPASTPRRSSNRSGAGARTGAIGFPLLVRRNRRLGFDARRIRERGRPGPLRDAGQHDVVALAAGAGPALGDPGAGRAALGRAPRPLPRRGAAGRRSGPAPVTWASLAPLALPDLPEEIGRRLVEEHLLNEREFLTPVAPPSVAASRAELRTRRRPRPDPPLLARADLDQLGLDGLAGHAPARLRGGGAAPGRRRDRRGRPRRPARVLRPAHRARAWAPRTSPGRSPLGSGRRLKRDRPGTMSARDPSERETPSGAICSGR